MIERQIANGPSEDLVKDPVWVPHLPGRPERPVAISVASRKPRPTPVADLELLDKTIERLNSHYALASASAETQEIHSSRPRTVTTGDGVVASPRALWMNRIPTVEDA